MMNELNLTVILKFNGEIENEEHVIQMVEEAIRYYADTRGIVADEDEAYTEDITVIKEEVWV